LCVWSPLLALHIVTSSQRYIVALKRLHVTRETAITIKHAPFGIIMVGMSTDVGIVIQGTILQVIGPLARVTVLVSITTATALILLQQLQ